MGNVSINASPGAYGISVVDPRFSYSRTATVLAGKVTHVGVEVNRTALPAEFEQIQDSTGQEEIGPWNRIVVEVMQGGIYFFDVRKTGPLYNPYIVGLSSNVNLSMPASFGTEVFLQPMKLGTPFGNPTPAGPEVGAAVVSQVPTSQATWLTLMPMGILVMTGSYYLSVISYAAGSSVRVSDV
jgi:hypothetical protein